MDGLNRFSSRRRRLDHAFLAKRLKGAKSYIGKAGVIEAADGSKTCFLGSINETKCAFSGNYEILWEDLSPEGVKWVVLCSRVLARKDVVEKLSESW